MLKIRALFGALAALVVLLPACNHRIPVPADDDDAGIRLDARPPKPDQRRRPDGPMVLPDGAIPDGMVPLICQKEKFPITLFNDPRGNFTLALRRDVQIYQATISSAQKTESAVALNQGPVAGFTLTRPLLFGPTEPDAQLHKLRQMLDFTLGQAGIGSTSVRASGTIGHSHEHQPDIKEAVWVIAAKPLTAPGSLRNRLLASFLGRSTAQVGNLPGGAVGTATHSLLVKLSLTVRAGQLTIMGAVVEQQKYDDPLQDAFINVDDLSNSTALSRAGKKTEYYCDISTFSGKTKADIIWVIDESGSMNDNRQDIVDNANVFFAKAQAAGLDFRMGVTGVKRPGAGILLGKFCSFNTTNKSDDGGADRFLLPSEKTTFSACVKNPPYYEGGSEHGITNAYFAVKSHLPREMNNPSRIRTDAQLAVIIVTDEAPQELKPGGSFLGRGGFLSYQDYKNYTCKLSADKEKMLSTFLGPLMELFSGKKDPQAKAVVHLIGGVCLNKCNADMAHGYRELATDLGGQIGDVCQKNLGATLQVMINSIIASASPMLLDHFPISSTLRVAVQGVELKRSRSYGFQYNVTNNTLTFNAIQLNKGHSIVAAYRRFQGSK